MSVTCLCIDHQLGVCEREWSRMRSRASATFCCHEMSFSCIQTTVYEYMCVNQPEQSLISTN